MDSLPIKNLTDEAAMRGRKKRKENSENPGREIIGHGGAAVMVQEQQVKSESEDAAVVPKMAFYAAGDGSKREETEVSVLFPFSLLFFQ